MNERIRELAEQARMYALTLENRVDDCNDVFEKKFAELIVRECILTIQRGITRDGHETEKYIRSMTHIKQIKQHFGVE
jgi:hypothetical protein